MGAAESGEEREVLREFLDYQREALIGKAHGLSEADARRAATVSSLSLLSIIKHCAIWERRWAQNVVAGQMLPGEWPETKATESDATFRLTDEDTTEVLIAYYREQIQLANTVFAGLDLASRCKDPASADLTVRWVLVHLIEETARHAGHADIIRETIDGMRGR